jgi:hypothetical protein
MTTQTLLAKVKDTNGHPRGKTSIRVQFKRDRYKKNRPTLVEYGGKYYFATGEAATTFALLGKTMLEMRADDDTRIWLTCDGLQIREFE